MATIDNALVLSGASRGLGAHPDFVALRADTGLVFRCACGCGGHALVDRAKMERLEAYRLAYVAKARKAHVAPAFGGAVYVTGHEPAGIIGASIRTGERTQLRATA